MATKIEWATSPNGMAGESWNVTAGCKEISQACEQCYARGFAWRHMHNPAQADNYAGTVRKDEAGLHWTGAQNLLEERLERPYHWKKGRLIFVNSMADLFCGTPWDYLDRVFETIRATPQHFYLILTKYAKSMHTYLEFGLGLKNAGLGVTVEHPDHLSRIDTLLDIPGTPLYFVSYGPALGQINTWPDYFRGHGRFYSSTALGWLIAEGQSGPRATPSHPNRFRIARDQCATADVPYFFKGWGAWSPNIVNARSNDRLRVLDDVTMYRMGKKRAGAMLDGHLHRQYPEVIKSHFREET